MSQRAPFATPAFWEAKTESNDGTPPRDKVFVAGVIVTAIIGLTVAFVWVLRDPAEAAMAAEGSEVSLGDFHFGTVGTSKPLMLAFEAVAVVQGSDASGKEQLLRSREARVAQAIEEAGRAVTDSELIEPDLNRFRSRIRGGVNRTLHANIVEDVVLYDFRAF
jgi:flagellar basal body-associated protein FliL